MRLTRNLLILIITALGVLLIWIFQTGLYSSNQISITKGKTETQSSQSTNNEKPEVTSTKPENLNDGTILPTDSIEITFNLPLENTGEFKHTFVPKVDYTLSLSSDRRTIKIAPKPSFALGTNYTLTILPDSKFNITPGQESTKKILDHDITLRFKTISYRGV